MRSASRRLLAATAATAVLVPATLGLATSADASDDEVTFTVGILQDVDSLNPFTGIVAEAYEMWSLMYDQLVGYAADDFSPVPQLAESWEESEDGLTWTYTIRDDASFADGEKLTADDVAYTFNRIIDGEYEQTNFGNYVANITSVEATDDTTVVMTVAEPSPIMLRLAIPILPEHIWSEIDEAAVADYSNDPDVEGGSIGTGPFTLVERSNNQFLRFEANEDYWGGAPNIDEVVFRIFTNQDSLAQALRRGEVDFADSLEANVFESLDGAEGVTTYPATYYGFDELAFNTGAALDDGTPIGDGHPALQDKQVRLAIAHAVDNQTIVDRVLGGYGEPATSVIPSLYEDLHYSPPEPYEFDLDRANQILDDAGYARGSDGIRVMPDGSQPLNFRLLGRQESETSQNSVQFIAGWLQEIGIATETEIVSEDTLTEVIGAGEFDMFEWGWVVEPDPDYQLGTFTCASRSYQEDGVIYANLSDSFYCNEAYDELYIQQSLLTDPAERAEVVKEMQRILYDDVPYVVTFYYADLQAYRSDRFTGFVPQPAPDGVYLFQYGTYSYRAIEPVDGGSGDGGGIGTGALIGIGVAAVVGIAAVGAVVMRRRGDASGDDVE